MATKWLNISASALGVFEECPRCFYLDRRCKSPRPRGIYPSLPNGMDLTLKKFFDALRKTGAIVYDNQRLTKLPELQKWRDWRSGLTVESGKFPGSRLIGAFDDILEDEEGRLSPFDVKTKGSQPDEGYAEKYYQRQMNIYDLMLTTNGYKTTGYGYFMFWSPKEVLNASSGGHGTMSFNLDFFKIKTDIEAAKKLCFDALSCLDSGYIPDASESCEYCKFVRMRSAPMIKDEIVN